jgi:4-amino-4-deoxy-L-arabinose transferase-like glycosyltransferase
MHRIEGWGAGVGIAIVALVTRLLHLFDLSRLPLFDRPTVDAALYVQFARDFVENGALPEVFYKPPLYPVLLGLWWQVVGDDFLLLRLSGILLGTLTALLVWWLARTVFDARIALVAGLLYALHAPAVYFEVELLEMGLVTCLQTAAMLLVLHSAQQRGTLRGLSAGIALGLGCIARPTFLPVALASLLWLGKRRWPPVLLGTLLLIAPVTLHNAWHGRDFVLISSNMGVNFYIGNNPLANGRISATADLPAEPAAMQRQAIRLAQQAEQRNLRPSEVSRYWLRQGLSYAATHPGHTLELLGRKIVYALHGAAVSDNEDLSGLRRYLHVQPWLPVGMWLLVPMGLVGMWATRRRSQETRYLQWCFVLQVAAVVPFFIVERFRLAWAPLLAIFAAYSLVHGIQGLRQRRSATQRAAAAVAVLLVLCNLPVWGVRDAVDFDLDYKIGYAWQQKGNTTAAMQAYRRSLQHHPHGALARNALGYLLAEQGTDLDEAARLIEEALQLDPDHTANYAESLAFVHLQRRDGTAALAACARGLAAAGNAPTAAALYWRRAQAYRLLAEPENERPVLQEALRLAPRGTHAVAIEQRLLELADP